MRCTVSGFSNHGPIPFSDVEYRGGQHNYVCANFPTSY
jgi:hypothetical protein